MAPFVSIDHLASLSMAPSYKEVKEKLKVANQEIADLKKKNKEKNKEINELKALLKAYKAEKKAAQRAPAPSPAPTPAPAPLTPGSSGVPMPSGRISFKDWTVIVERRNQQRSCVIHFDGSQRNFEHVVPIKEKVMSFVESQVRKAKAMTNTMILKEEAEAYDLMNVVRGMDDYSNSQFAFELPKELPVLPGDAEFYENL